MLHSLSIQFSPGILFWLTPGVLLFIVVRRDREERRLRSQSTRYPA
jgi:protein-S-isoprenylcysteine O-methyltransferase Ste14